MLWLTSFDETTDLLEFFFILKKPCFKCLIVHRINFVIIEYKFDVVFPFLIVFILEITDYFLLFNTHFL